jgi:AcrR family transcriptional regulator
MPRSQPSPIRGSARAISTRARREAILEAALQCFVRHGYAGTSIEEVRQLSGASIGSLYHHFDGKQGIAAALYVDVVKDYQEAMIERLEDAPSAEAGIRGVVSEHFRWVRKNGDRARFLLTWPDREVQLASQGAIRNLNRRFAQRFERWFRRAQAEGAIREVPVQGVVAMIVGSCRQLTELWLRDGREPDAAAVRTLGDLVWRAVGATK